MCDEVELVINAIEDDNPDTDVEVIDRGAYVRVQAAGRLRVTEVSLQRHLGPQFHIRSLGSIMSSFAGRIATRSDEVTWEYKTRTGEVAR
jgi:toluene monooxygenase system protein D